MHFFQESTLINFISIEAEVEESNRSSLIFRFRFTHSPFLMLKYSETASINNSCFFSHSTSPNNVKQFLRGYFVQTNVEDTL